MIISDKDLETQTKLLYDEYSGKGSVNVTKIYDVLTYFSSVSKGLLKAPVPIDYFGRLFIYTFAFVILFGLIIPAISGLYRIGLRELGNICAASFLLVLVSVVKHAIGITEYVAEKCSSPYCTDDVKDVVVKQEQYIANTQYDDKKRLYRKARKIDTQEQKAGDTEQDVYLDEDEDEEETSRSFAF